MNGNHSTSEMFQLAREAHLKAQEAYHMADKAYAAVERLEKINAENYKGLTETLKSFQNNLTTSQATMQNSINNLSNANHESIGKWKGISYVSLGLTVVYSVLKIFNIAP